MTEHPATVVSIPNPRMIKTAQGMRRGIVWSKSVPKTRAFPYPMVRQSEITTDTKIVEEHTLVCRNKEMGRNNGVLLQRVELLQLLVEYLSGDLNALVTGSLDNLVVGTCDRGGVKDVREMLNHGDVTLGPINPCVSFRIKEPFMDAAIRDWHT